MDNFINLYQKRLNLENSLFSRIDHEDAMVAIVYKVTLPNGMEFILKICSRSNDYLREIYFLKYFADKLPVPRIIDVVPPETDLHGAILMEYLPGQLLKMGDFTDPLAYELGFWLASIHLNRTSGYGDLIQPEGFQSDPYIHFTLKFQEGIDECRGHLPQQLIEQCLLYYDKNLNLLTTVDGPCIIHRDFRAGNVIVDNGKIRGIIDWSSGRASFVEDDFCTMEHGNMLSHPLRKKAFLSAYESIRPVPDYTVIIPFLRLNKAIGTIGFTVKRGTWNNCDSRVYQYNRQFLETFFIDF